MAKQLKLPRSEAALAGLRRSHLQRRTQSAESVRRAIRKLQEAGSPVTLGRIAKATRELSADGDGISETTILRNPECRRLYEEAAQPVRRRRTVKRALAQGDTPGPTAAEVQRLHYLQRMTKAELAAQIIKVERPDRNSMDRSRCSPLVPRSCFHVVNGFDEPHRWVLRKTVLFTYGSSGPALFYDLGALGRGHAGLRSEGGL